MNLKSISPIDGRYSSDTEPFADIFSESALIKYRLKVEAEYLIFLSEHDIITTRKFSYYEKNLIREFYKNFSDQDCEVIKLIETKGYKNIKPTNHDVKAIEYFMKEKLKETSLRDSLEWIHFALTSEDVNNISYGMMLSDGMEKILIPYIEKVYELIDQKAYEYENISMLSRTHGQPASPTVFGMVFKTFASRIEKQLKELRNYEILVKLNGATGNYNAHEVAFPGTDWLTFTKNFVQIFDNGRSFRLKPNYITTQIEPHDSYVTLFDKLRLINNIIIDFDQDMWRYISDGWIIQKPIEGEIGSSTMPHKINPIDFENSEGNLGLSNSLLMYFSEKLPISRLQRDLSDSTVKRNIGSAFSYALIGYKSAQKGLNKISLNEDKIIEELKKHPEVISEAIQVILKKEGFVDSYEQLMEFTKGKQITFNDIGNFIENLDISEDVKKELKKITPENYIGIANLLVNINLKDKI